MISFGPFHLDEDDARLWLGEAELRLRPKSFAVLSRLVRRSGRLVTREELFRSCWPGTAVSQTVLRTCIMEIRAALAVAGAEAPTIENVGRRGYRLSVVGEAGGVSPRTLVGREGELVVLQRALARADAGLRQVVFVSGEAGIGKTTLLDRFVEETRTGTNALVVGGQCVELAGGTIAYLPILDLLGRLCAEEANDGATTALERWAPSWLLQLPGVVDAATVERLRLQVPNPNRERMLRELADAFEALAAERTLMLVIEDLHWSDRSSIEALAYLAQRTRPARLLLVASSRPADAAHADLGLASARKALIAQRRAVDLALAPLSVPDVATYLTHRLPGAAVAPGIAESLHARTSGNPLFVTATVDFLLERELLAPVDGRWQLAAPLDGVVPDSLRQLALRRLERLSPSERSVVAAASVAGDEFPVAAVAAATGLPVDDIEDVCARLVARDELVAPTGVAVWPDGTISSRYAFRHVLYREIVEDELRPAQRARLHRAVADRLEVAYGARCREIAAELAAHYEAAGDAVRAADQHLAAAAAAKERFAEREVITHLRAALEQMAWQPHSTERERAELACLLDLGGALATMRGAGSDDVLAVHRRALEVADRLDLPQARVQAQSGSFTFLIMRADLERARLAAADLLTTAGRLPFPFFEFVGRVSMGGVLANLGDLAGARREFERAHAIWDPGYPLLALDAAVIYRSMLGFTALMQGEPDVGARWIDDMLARAASLGNPYNVSYANELAAQYQATIGDRDRALAHADTATALADEHGFPVHAAVATVVRGWVRRDAAAIRAGIADYEAAGQFVATSLFRALLIEVLLEAGEPEAALAEIEVAFAFVARSGERRHLAELHRLKGECLRLGGPNGPSTNASAAECFERARDIARERGARLWELRAATSLARLLAADGKRAAARTVLADAAGLLPADVDLPDVTVVRRLAAEL